MNSISKNSAFTFLSQLIIFILGIATTIIIGRVLGPTGKGIYTLIILIPTLMLRLGTLGIEVSNVYFTGSKKYEIREIVSNSLTSGILLGFILIFLFWCIYHLNIFHKFIDLNKINPFYLWLVVFIIPLSLIFIFLKNVLLGKEEIIKFNKINIFQTCIQLISVTIFLLILNQGIFGAILSYIITIIIPTFFIIILIRKIEKIKFSLNKKLLKSSICYGIKAYIGNIVQFLNYRLDMFLVAYFLAPKEVGLYSVAVVLAEELWMLPNAIATVLFPRISSMENLQVNALTPKVSRHTFFLTFICSIILAFISKPLIKIFFGDAFLPSVMPLLILLPGIIALGGAKTISADLAGRGRPEFSTFASFISLAMNIPLNILFIPKWGISGAAFASTVAYCSATAFVIIEFLKISKTTLPDILFLKINELSLYKNIFLIKR